MVIPDSVTSIGEWAFYNCSSLTSVIIGDSVTSIGEWAFHNCSSLTSVVIPDSVTSIGYDAFRGCSGLTSVTIGDNVTSIGYSAFNGCSSLTSVVIPDSVTSIGDSVFYNCSSLTSIEIPDSVTSIGHSAFQGCSSLTEIILPFVGSSINASRGYDQVFGYIFGYKTESISTATISGATYQYCDSSNSSFKIYYHYYIPASLKSVTITSATSISSSAFYNCSSLTSVVIGNSVTSIGSYAFEDCSSLTSIEIPDDVTSIGSYAFSYCSSLTGVVIGDSVTSIGNSAFSNCPSLTRIIVSDDNMEYASQDGVLYNKEKTSILNVPKAITGSVEIPDGIASLSSEFAYHWGLTEIIIPNSVTSIENGAFRGCGRLESIVLPFVGMSSSATKEYQKRFGYIFGYTTVKVESYADRPVVEGATFQYMEAIDFDYDRHYYYYIPSSLKSITITGNTIPNNAFYNCNSLTSVIISDSVTSIGNSAFSNCPSLTRIIVSDDNMEYASQDGVLYNKEKTSILNVPKAITGSVEIPDSVTSIGDSVFYNCSSLTSIEIPDGVTSIGRYTFYNCSSLTSVYYTGTAEEWSAISIDSYNTPLTNATRYYYSETAPALNADGTAYDGNYWHYDESGEIVVWVYTKPEE